MFFLEMNHQVISVSENSVAARARVVSRNPMHFDIMPSGIVSVREELVTNQAGKGRFNRPS